MLYGAAVHIFARLPFVFSVRTQDQRTEYLTKNGTVIKMDKRIYIINIIVSSRDAAASLNALLHEYGNYIIGRFGLPYSERGISIVCVILDCPQDVASALSGKLGMLPDVNAKTMAAKLPQNG